MSDRDISPVPDSPKPESAGHYKAEDDIELPPMPDSDSTAADESFLSGRTDGGDKPSGIAKAIGTVVLIAAVVFGGWFATRTGSAEKQHPNWQHVEAASAASTEAVPQLVHLDAGGGTRALQSIELTSADRDQETMRQVRAALRQNDLITATAMLQAGQRMPSASQNPDVRPPVLTADSELTQALGDGRNELYQIELFDCCDEDGDVVEVVVNGASFATVPIVHGGTLLSIPFERGNNTVTIRGVKDGGGGVTVSFRTSRGDYFARSMRVGEEHQMGVVVQ